MPRLRGRAVRAGPKEATEYIARLAEGSASSLKV
jgi:hypothetical protein